MNADFTNPPVTRIAEARLRVPDRAASRHFYSRIVGLDDTGMEDSPVLTGAHDSRLVLLHDPGAKPQSRRAAGLFHIAFRYPTRGALGAALRRLIEAKYPIQGAADHGVSEAIYLADPSGNGIELTCDRPLSEWPRSGAGVAMVTEPLDLDGLLAEPPDGAGRATERPGSSGSGERPDIGHIHLQVTDLARSSRFYTGLVGLDVTQDDFPGALFLAAHGYHHHIGVNVWNSRGGPAFQAEGLGLVSFTIALGSQDELALVRSRASAQAVTLAADSPQRLDLTDPDGIRLSLIA